MSTEPVGAYARPALRGRRRPALEPYEQGHLDGLCGVYAIINALRLASRNEAPEEDAWAWLFAQLIAELDRSVGAAHALVHGINTKPLWKLAKRAVALLVRDYDLPVAAARPLKGEGEVTLSVALDCIANSLARGGTAVLMGVGGPLDHWTVVISVSPLHLMLFDSSGYTRLKQDRCAVGRAKAHPGKHLLTPKAIFEFRLG